LSKRITHQRNSQRQSRYNEFKHTLLISARIARNQGPASLLAQSLEKIRKREFWAVPPLILDTDYASWISQNEPQERDLKEQHEKAGRFSYRPLLSIVMPVWNPPPTLLADSITSVISQTYDKWELCIADGNSNIRIKQLINTFVNQDHRIKVQFLTKNLGISLNSNVAIQSANGDYVVLLDHDDLLAPNALYDIVTCLNLNRKLDFIYSDMDLMTIEGKRTDPLFKPDWSPDTMLCANFVTHLCVTRSKLLRDIGAFRPETDGAQDWDLFLRVSEKTERIQHVPKILYHWRQSPSSVSNAGIRAKPYAKNAQLLTLSQFLARNGMHGKISHEASGCLQVTWEVDHSTLISIVIFDGSTPERLHSCTQSILKKSSHTNIEIIVVHDRTESLKSEFNPAGSKIKFVKSVTQLTYPLAYNLGAAISKGEIIVFMDSRTEVVSPNWLQELAGWCSKPNVAVAGPQLLSRNGGIIHSGVVIGLPGYLFQGARQRSQTLFGYTEWYRNCTAISGFCLATKKKTFEEIGKFNKHLTTVADVEFCLRARKMAYRMVHTPHAKLLLHDSIEQSANRFQDYRSLGSGQDHYFNPNLSYEHTIPTLN
jgi:glycosyltransferase involved in cell wall biosynthesis